MTLWTQSLETNLIPEYQIREILKNRTIESRNFQNYWRPPLADLNPTALVDAFAYLHFGDKKIKI